MSEIRFVLAFDSACGSCSRLSARIARACDGRLETLPLTHPDVVQWRASALGASAEPAPTLVRSGPDGITAWTGRGMILPLVRHLGLRSSIAVTHALGGLRDELAAEREPHRTTGLSRKRFLQWGAGAAIAGALAVSGRIPAYAADPVSAWVREQARKGTLPTSYQEIAGLPLDYRRAAFVEASPAIRSALWVEHLRRQRDSLGSLTGEQRELFDIALAKAADPATFAAAGDPADVGFRQRAQQAFGADRAMAIFATLGPAAASTRGPQYTCDCAYESDWCSGDCGTTVSCSQVGGCGDLWRYTCDGLCG